MEIKPQVRKQSSVYRIGAGFKSCPGCTPLPRQLLERRTDGEKGRMVEEDRSGGEEGPVNWRPGGLMTMLINIFEASATRRDGTKPLASISISKPSEASARYDAPRSVNSSLGRLSGQVIPWNRARKRIEARDAFSSKKEYIYIYIVVEILIIIRSLI